MVGFFTLFLQILLSNDENKILTVFVLNFIFAVCRYPMMDMISRAGPALFMQTMYVGGYGSCLTWAPYTHVCINKVVPQWEFLYSPNIPSSTRTADPSSYMADETKARYFWSTNLSMKLGLLNQK